MPRATAGLLRASSVIRFLAALLALVGPLNFPTARAEEVQLKDGRKLRGRMDFVNSVIANPLAAPTNKGGGPVPLNLILLCDNDLSRTFVSKRNIADLDKGLNDTALTEINVKHNQQQVARTGKRVVSVGSITFKNPYDKFGRRTASIATPTGAKDIIMGITLITPNWMKVEGLNTAVAGQFQYDARVPTSSLTREELSMILRQASAGTVEERMKVVKLLVQSERYKEAMVELDQVIHDFPQVAALVEEVRNLRKLYARRILKEIEFRRDASQHQLALNMLEQFPTDGMPGEILAEVAAELKKTRGLYAEGKTLVEQLTALMDQCVDKGMTEKVTSIREEMKTELSFNTLQRLSAFKRLADDPKLTADEKVSLAITGWLLGADEAVTDVKACVTLVDVRDQARKFLNEPVKLERDKLLSRMAAQPYATPLMVEKLLQHMKPPVPTELVNKDKPGYYELESPGAAGSAPVSYVVQLPPEYDPYREYPTIVTLSAGWTSPELQIDWWAGPLANGARNGQAMRQGYIVIAPNWMDPHQKKFESSAREHAIVLGALRDACRRFSVDTDRVYLSGHSQGGDAAWDIGLAHPDLWAGVIPIVATSGKYIARYDGNAKYVPTYFLGGELDGSRMQTNAIDLNRYLTSAAYDCTVVEYLGRGHENFSDDILQLFDWMGRKQRKFNQPEFEVSTMRPWDNFFWWIETRNMPAKTMVDPADWPPPANTRAMTIKGKVANNSNINVTAQGSDVTVWLTPDIADFNAGKSITITINGRSVGGRKTLLQPDLKILLDDVRTRADRKHPFWAKVETP